jgi:hypothetical protein
MAQPNFAKIALLVCVSFYSTLIAQAQDDDDPFGETPEEAAYYLKHEPDHLLEHGISVGDWAVRYRKKLNEELQLNRNYFARMLVKPSFSGEYCVLIHGAQNERDIATTPKIYITYIKASKSVYYSMPENNDENKELPNEIKKVTIKIPKGIAIRLVSIWDRMLIRTKSSDSWGAGLDGTTTIFSTWMRVGETWSPRTKKSPLLLCELGQTLITYCESNVDQRLKVLEKVDQKLINLNAHLDKNPQ